MYFEFTLANGYIMLSNNHEQFPYTFEHKQLKYLHKPSVIDCYQWTKAFGQKYLATGQ